MPTFIPFQIWARLTLSVSYSLTLQPLPLRCGHVCLLPNDSTEEELSRDMSHVLEQDIWQGSCLFGCVRGYYANQSIYIMYVVWLDHDASLEFPSLGWCQDFFNYLCFDFTFLLLFLLLLPLLIDRLTGLLIKELSIADIIIILR